jgi:diguanylate cyclase (GGDEF)-like protein
MTDVLGAVPKPVGTRDKDDAEIAIAAAIRRVAQAIELRLWRVARIAGETVFREHIRLRHETPGSKPEGNAAQTKEIFDDTIQADLLKCLETRAHVGRPANANGLYCELFPALGGRDVVYLLEIHRVSPLPRDQRVAVLELLRIYFNLVTTLDTSDRDQLTGLLSKRTFAHAFKIIMAPINAPLSADEVPTEERRRNEYRSRHAHLAVIDIDFFSKIKNQFGLSCGEEVLALLGRHLTGCFREYDRVFRFGGDKFIVVLPNTDFQDAEIALERLRARVEAFDFPQVGRVTVSIGFTKLLGGDGGPAAFGRADQALVFAKNSGRNQTQLHELLIENGNPVRAAAIQDDDAMF